MGARRVIRKLSRVFFSGVTEDVAAIRGLFPKPTSPLLRRDQSGEAAAAQGQPAAKGSSDASLGSSPASNNPTAA